MFHRFSLVVIAIVMFFAAVAQAAFPPCAEACIGVASVGSCAYTDNACICQNAAYCNATNNCFRDSCSYDDWVAAYNYAVGMCNQAGVTQPNILNPPRKRSDAPEAKRAFAPVYAGSPARARV